MILTTEDGVSPDGESLLTLPLVWVGAPGGTVWRTRPLKLAYCPHCIFRAGVLAALDDAGIVWDMAVDSDQTGTVEVSVAADLAIQVLLDGTIGPLFEKIQHGGALPDLAQKEINLYFAESGKNPVLEGMAALIRQGFHSLPRVPLSRVA
jgi:hypothetical protein